MSKSMYCSHCGAFVGDCGHEPGMTTPVTLSGTCQCGSKFSVTCNGDCVKNEKTDKDISSAKCNGTGVIVVKVEETCSTCDGSGKVLEHTCSTCRGTGKMTVMEERNCPGCVNCRK